MKVLLFKNKITVIILCFSFTLFIYILYNFNKYNNELKDMVKYDRFNWFQTRCAFKEIMQNCNTKIEIEDEIIYRNKNKNSNDYSLFIKITNEEYLYSLMPIERGYYIIFNDKKEIIPKKSSKVLVIRKKYFICPYIVKVPLPKNLDLTKLK